MRSSYELLVISYEKVALSCFALAIAELIVIVGSWLIGVLMPNSGLRSMLGSDGISVMSGNYHSVADVFLPFRDGVANSSWLIVIYVFAAQLFHTILFIAV